MLGFKLQRATVLHLKFDPLFGPVQGKEVKTLSARENAWQLQLPFFLGWLSDGRGQFQVEAIFLCSCVTPL